MNDKEFRKLRRKDLIEIIYQYQCREEHLIQENEALHKKLQERQTKIQNAGSIAEASLCLSGVFEAAQKAADQYLMEIRSMHTALAQMAEEKTACPKTPADRQLPLQAKPGPVQDAGPRFE